jgi:hypothetical protein
MKKSILFLLTGWVCISCNQRLYNHTQKRQMKEAYVYSFKTTYFRKMLLAGFRNSDEIKKVLTEDHSYFSENILSLEDFQFIDSVVSVDLAKMVADSAYSIGRMAEGAEGKRVFDNALKRYHSKWLTRMAKKRSVILNQW